MKKRLELVALLKMIDEPNQSKCFELFQEYRPRMVNAPGSLKKHQAWEGGYVDHLEETMNMAIYLYELFSVQMNRPLPFTLSDALLILFLHDKEKPFAYIEPKERFDNQQEKMAFIKKLFKAHGLILTADHWNALEYIHGEGSAYNPTKRIQGPLSAFCHGIDNFSARLFFDYPKQ